MFQKFILVLSFFSCCAQLVFGNSHGGSAFVTNIRYSGNQQNYVWSIAQTSQGTILIAGKTGLYEYDSESWTLIETPDAPLSMITDKEKNRVYISGRDYIGYLTEGKNKKLKFEYIESDINLYGNFNQSIENDTSIFFCSPHQLVCVSKADSRAIYSHDNWENPFLGIFSFKNSLYLNLQNEGSYRIDSTGLVPVELNLINNQSIVFNTCFSDDQELIGTDNGDLFLFDGNILEPYIISDSEFLQSGILSDGVFIDSQRLALSTKNFGVIIVDKESGKTLSTINYQSGLPNDFVTSLFVDKQAGLWIAHPRGLSRIDTKLPLYSYSSYPGLNSGVVSLEYWNQKLYIATTTGVFVLDTINRYDTKELIKRIPVKQKAKQKFQAETIPSAKNEMDELATDEYQEPKTETDSLKDNSKRGFLKRLFSKKEQKDADRAEKLLSDEIPEQAASKADISRSKIAPIQKYEIFRYEQYVLKAKDYGFSKIPGIDRRCKLLIPCGEKLLAVTDSKIYSINEEKEAEEIFSNVHIYAVIKSTYNPYVVYSVTEGGIFIGKYNNKQWEFEQILESKTTLNATGIEEYNANTLIIAMPNSLLVYSLSNSTTSNTMVVNPYSERILLRKADGKTYMVIGDSFYLLNLSKSDQLTLDRQNDVKIINALKNQHDQLWLDCENHVFRYYGTYNIPDNLYSFLKIFDNINDIFIDEDNNLWLVENFKNIFKINLETFENYQADVEVLIQQITSLNSGRMVYQGQKLKYAENALEFNVVSPTYLMLNSNQYQYIIEGLMGEWSEWSSEHIISIPYLPHGNYTFKVRAKNIFGVESGIKSFAFKITPPFWETPYFFVAIILVVIISLYFSQKYRMKKHLQEKKILQQKVLERTIELELKNKSITDSIIYAERIQMGMLPAPELINTSLGDNFVLFKPKNIVSGDFYWLAQKENLTFVVAADCTGHGVPGAFMSMLGIAYLNEIVRKSQPSITPAEVLEKLRERIVKLFSQESFKTNDGMDVALLVINSQKSELQFAGAYNPLYQVTKSDNPEIDKQRVAAEKDGFSLIAYKADRFHVGKAAREYKTFTNHIIKYHPDDTFYIFSDGYVDQFGGDEETKFKFGPFKSLILDVHSKPMDIQKEILITRFNAWKRDFEQTDDVLIWGLKVKDI